MALSKETIQERYGSLEPLTRIRRMIEDDCDTELIMNEVIALRHKAYKIGCEHTASRYANKPGNGDMGG